METHQKLLLRWYLTPYRLSRVYHGTSPLCWRQCGEVGTLIHIMWSCPKLSHLWSGVWGIARDILNTLGPLTPGLAVLSLELDNIPVFCRRVVSNLLLATRLVILRHWKNVVTPSLTEIISTMHIQGKYEIMHSYTMGSSEAVTTSWTPWLQWYSNYTGL